MKISLKFTKNALKILLPLALFGIIFSSGFYFGSRSTPDIDKVSLWGKEEGKPEQVDFSPFWKSWNVINEKYVSTNGPDDQEKVWGAIQGLAASLDDPYTVFLPPSDNEIFESDIKGNFEGVGMEIGVRDDVLTVVAPLKNTPAEKAGVLPMDKIIEINGSSTAKIRTDEAVKLIRGPRGTDVVLTVVREGVSEPIEISITRDTIDIPTIDTELTEVRNGVFIIRLYNFSAVSPNLFREALREFIVSGRDKLVLDLRGNPGGFLEASVDMASWFLPAGKVIVRENFGADKEERIYRSKGYDIFNENLKFVILTNGGSASASEILAGALKEHGKAKIVGEKTFGKGSVQELVKITPEASLKVTVARWLTPDGNSISEGGLSPDVEVKITLEDIENGVDPQMDKAIELLNE